MLRSGNFGNLRSTWLPTALILSLVTVISFLGWLLAGEWPDPKTGELFHSPDAIVVLGGGDEARIRQAANLAASYPELPLIVTGDGGSIVSGLLEQGIPRGRIIHEQAAKTTVENAIFTEPLLAQLHARRVILVTNWFHAPRSLKTFEKYQPLRDFVVSFEPKPEPLTKWNRDTQLRERLAMIYNLFRHGIWSF